MGKDNNEKRAREEEENMEDYNTTEEVFRNNGGIMKKSKLLRSPPRKSSCPEAYIAIRRTEIMEEDKEKKTTRHTQEDNENSGDEVFIVDDEKLEEQKQQEKAKNEGKNKNDIDEFLAQCENIKMATNRFQAGKVQFNRAEQIIVKDATDFIKNQYIKLLAETNENNKLGQQKLEKLSNDVNKLRESNNKLLAQMEKITKMLAQGKHTTQTHDMLQTQGNSQHGEEIGTNWTTVENKRKKSYASAAARDVGTKWKTPEKKEDLHTVIKVNNVDNTKDAIKKLKENIQDKSTYQKIRQIKPLDDGRIIIQSKTAEGKMALEQQMRKDVAIQISNKEKQNPKLTLTGIGKQYEETEIKSIIMEENTELLMPLAKQWENVKFLKKSQCRDPNKFNWTFESDPDLFKALVKQETLYFDLTMVHIVEHLVPTQCFKCHKYGHVAKYCKSAAICHKCGGGHEGKDCSSTTLDCPNCKIKGKTPRGHTARDKLCPIYREKAEQQKNTINYGP